MTSWASAAIPASGWSSSSSRPGSTPNRPVPVSSPTHPMSPHHIVFDTPEPGAGVEERAQTAFFTDITLMHQGLR